MTFAFTIPMIQKWISKFLLRAWTALLAVSSLVSASTPTQENIGTLECEPRGVAFQAPDMGTFIFEGPTWIDASGQATKGTFTALSKTEGLIEFADGGVVEVGIDTAEMRINYHVVSRPADGIGFRVVSVIPANYNQGGQFSFEDNWTPFPLEKKDKFIDRSRGTSFKLRDPAGRGFQLETSLGNHILQDNRFFDWATYWYMYEIDYKHGSEPWTFSIKISRLASAAGEVAFILDRFGQSLRGDYPGKVRDESELARDVSAEKAYYAAFPPLPVDSYGGWKDSGVHYGLKATGFFYPTSVEGRQVLVDPGGNVFLQSGVCLLKSHDDVTYVLGRKHVYEWLPDQRGEFASAFMDNYEGHFSFYRANWIRKFKQPFSAEEWSEQVIDRLKALGFNSTGAWCEVTPAYREKNFPYCLMLAPLGYQKMTRLPGVREVFDPFAEGTEQLLEEAFAKTIASRANDPLIIGYFVGNEPTWDDVPRVVAGLDGKSPAKRRLVQLLQERYASIEDFNEAWKPSVPFVRFEDVLDASLRIHTARASDDMAEFFRLFADAYYGSISRAFRKFDTNHLLLGDRLMPSSCSNDDLIRIGGRYMDVISVNYYAYSIDADFLKRIHDLSGERPLLLSEWHFTSPDRGASGGREVASQEERGLAFRNYVEQAIALPFVVGQTWFSYIDQSLTGRFAQKYQGEALNSGLVDVVDRPYKELLRHAFEANAGIYDVAFGKKKPFRFDDPRFDPRSTEAATRVVAAPRILPNAKIDGQLTDWPGVPAELIPAGRVTIGTVDPAFHASFRAAWDEENLFVFVHVRDATPRENSQPQSRLWDADAVELFIGSESFDQGGRLLFGDRQFVFSASDDKMYVYHAPVQPTIQRTTVTDVDGKGYSLEIAIPWDALSVKPKDGVELLFDLAVNDGDGGAKRVRQLMWNGNERNASERSSWGRLKLIP